MYELVQVGMEYCNMTQVAVAMAFAPVARMFMAVNKTIALGQAAYAANFFNKLKGDIEDAQATPIKYTNIQIAHAGVLRYL